MFSLPLRIIKWMSMFYTGQFWIVCKVPAYVYGICSLAVDSFKQLYLPADGHVGPIRRLLWMKGDEQIISCSDDCKIKVRNSSSACVTMISVKPQPRY